MRKGVPPPSLCPHLCLFLEFLSSSLPILLPFPNPFYLLNFNQNAASYRKPALISWFNVLSLPFESGQARGEQDYSVYGFPKQALCCQCCSRSGLGKGPEPTHRPSEWGGAPENRLGWEAAGADRVTDRGPHTWGQVGPKRMEPGAGQGPPP